jgi:putative Ca2+/H+ antiporter (TMEM165/GDT1 family)
MEAFLVSTGVVALAEFGDKSQLFVLALATTFRKPVPIILGMVVAILLNHTAAAAAGVWLASILGPLAMRWILGLSFVAIGVWTLLPDKIEQRAQQAPRLGVFGTTLIFCFLLEMGDKTQFATIALAAKYGSLLAVICGSTVGILLADIPVILLGATAAEKLPMRSVRKFAPAIFMIIGTAILCGAGFGK